jgi:hypothetical protein
MKNSDKLLNILFIIAIGFSGYTLFNVYMSRKNLPLGTCPMTSYSTEITISIILCAAYFVLSLIFSKLKKS